MSRDLTIVIGFLDPKIMDRIENDRIFFLDPFGQKIAKFS